MAAALAFAVSLALVLTLIALLLADHFCSALRRWGLRREAAADHTCNASTGSWGATEALEEAMDAPTPPLSKPPAFSFFGHGVLQAPTSYLLTVPNLEAAAAMPPAFCRPVLATPSAGSFGRASSVSAHSTSMDHLVYISNPIYDGGTAGSGGRGGENENDGGSTPFETPETSPSQLGCEDEDEDLVKRSDDDSPALTVMRKLPPVRPKAWMMMDGQRQSVATSASATETNMASFFSSSGSPSSSPSW